MVEKLKLEARNAISNQDKACIAIEDYANALDLDPSRYLPKCQVSRVGLGHFSKFGRCAGRKAHPFDSQPPTPPPFLSSSLLIGYLSTNDCHLDRNVLDHAGLYLKRALAQHHKIAQLSDF